jgi:pyrimidine operon attenuation protein/uracil phosphoribosyltransferase
VNNTNIWQEAEAIDTTLAGMAEGLQATLTARKINQPLMVGIHTGGMWIAQRLHQMLAIEEALGALDIAFYRDDFTRIGLHPLVRPSQIPVTVDDRHIVLIDDVLHTGRTIRAALNALFDYGRPASVLLVALAVRNGRELPITPDIVGLQAVLSADQHIKLEGPSPLRLVFDRPRGLSAAL